MKKTMEQLRILLIEDHMDIAENIIDFLELQGHIVDYAMDGISGMHLALTKEFEVIVLDLMLPGMDGLTLCEKLRTEAEKQIPVLMLTARDTLSDKLTGFKAGADDYLVKPFALEELLARVLALSKRQHVQRSTELVVADLKLDLGTMCVSRAGQPISLNRTCVTILKTLMKAYPNIVSRQDLEVAIWGDEPPGSDALRSHLYTLRNKINKPFPIPILHTVHGLGYCLKESDET